MANLPKKTMKFPIAMGLIGVGGMGVLHRNAIERLRKENRAYLHAIADPAIDKFPGLRRELENQGVRLYVDYRAMLNSEPELQSVTIATPTPFHEEMTRTCLMAGLKVYLEKPPVPLIQQLDELIELDAQENVRVGYQLISSGWAEQIKQWIVDGRFGDVTSIRAGCCWPRTDRYYNRASWAGKMSQQGRPVFDGPATNALSHLIHTITYFAAAEEDSFAEPEEICGELYRARPIESYDVTCARGRFPSGIEFEVALTHATQREWPFQIHITGSKGWARVSQNGARLESPWGESHFTNETGPSVDECYRRYMDFIEGNRGKVLTSLKQTRGYVLATNGMLLSSGGIHDIDPAWINTYEVENGDRGFDVSALYESIIETVRTGALFSEQGRPWAKPSTTIRIDQLTRSSLRKPIASVHP